ncbi:MAG: DUF1501 domain-containing protein [Pirellulales bacterium]
MSASFFSDYSRRDLFRISLASAFGVSYSGWLPALASAAVGQKGSRACILLWMNGGPSQLDTFDLKPGHKNGGPFQEIETAVPGIRMSEHLPGLARQMKDIAIIRGMTSKEGDHGRATRLMMTGYRPQEAVRYPCLGSIVAKELGRDDNEVANYVSVSPLRFADVGAGFLGPKYAPLTVSGDSDDPGARANLSIENLAPPLGVDGESMKNRVGLLNFLESEFNEQFPGESAGAHRANYDRAIKMVQTQARSAFKLQEESAELRDDYGRNRFGQGCLLARRLVERGVPFVEVTLARVPGNDFAWDTHQNNFEMVRLLSQVLDPACSTLIRDLREHGLLESTLIVWMGEFGRTPAINGQNGRDHFPGAWTTLLAGGLIQGGQVIGRTTESGMEVEDRPVGVPEFFATICAALDIDYRKDNASPEGRPIAIVDGRADPVKELLSKAPA